MSSALVCNALGSLLVGLFGDHLFAGARNLADALALVIVAGLVVGGFVTCLGLPTYRRHMRRIAEEN